MAGRERVARYRDYDYSQGKLLPVYFDTQILPSTFEYTLHYLIDHEIDLSLLMYATGTAEPVFDHELHTGADRTLRGKRKVNTQRLLYCIVYNLTKVHRYGEGFA